MPRPSVLGEKRGTFCKDFQGGQLEVAACSSLRSKSQANRECSMPAPFQGGCRCGAVRYEVSAEPIAVMDCHCRDCQYASGGSHTTAVVVPGGSFKLTKGTPKRFTVTGDTGKEVTRSFCGDCGSPLFSEPQSPQKLRVTSLPVSPVTVKRFGVPFVSLNDPPGTTTAVVWLPPLAYWQSRQWQSITAMGSAETS